MDSEGRRLQHTSRRNLRTACESPLPSPHSPHPAGRAAAIYERQVRPVLEGAAGCSVEMHLTRARAHATGSWSRLVERGGDCRRELAGACGMRRCLPSCLSLLAGHLHVPPTPSHPPAELVRAVAPGAFDAVVAIGGDGTMFEVLQVRLLPLLLLPRCFCELQRKLSLLALARLTPISLPPTATIASKRLPASPPTPTPTGHAGPSRLGGDGGGHPLCPGPLRQRQRAGRLHRPVERGQRCACCAQGAAPPDRHRLG